MARAQSIPLPLELRSLLAGLPVADVPDDQRWIVALMRKEGLIIINLLWRMLGSEEDVLDAYQTAVCRLTARGERAIGSNRFGYFYRTAMNTGIEILRRRKRRREHWPAIRQAHQQRPVGPPDVERFDQREVLQRMRRAICQLPPYLRNVVILRDLGELPYAQVSRILGIRPGTARLYRRHAVVRLAELIGREASQ